LKRLGPTLLKGTKAVPSGNKLILANRGAGAARGAFVGGSTGNSAGEAYRDNLVVGSTGDGSSNTVRNFTGAGAVGGATLGFLAPNNRFVSGKAVGLAAANQSPRLLGSDRTLASHANQLPKTTGISDNSALRIVTDGLKDPRDVSAMDVLEDNAPDDFEVNPLMANRLQKLKDSAGARDLLRRSTPTPGGSTDIADLARRLGRAALPVASAAFQGGRRLGRAGLVGVGGLLDVIRANAQKSLSNTPGQA